MTAAELMERIDEFQFEVTNGGVDDLEPAFEMLGIDVHELNDALTERLARLLETCRKHKMSVWEAATVCWLDGNFVRAYGERFGDAAP